MWFKKEIIISDNNSTDGTKKSLKDLNEDSVKCLFKEKNEGKGANIRKRSSTCKRRFSFISRCRFRVSSRKLSRFNKTFLR